MKSKFLLFTLLLAFMMPWAANAQTTVTIGDLANATNNSFLPMNSLYEYSYTQQIYDACEIGTAGTITAITVWMYGNANLYEMPFDIYMREVDKDVFENATDWVTVTTDDIVYSGSVTVHNTETQAFTFTLNNPFEFSGRNNLLIAFDNNTGQWKSGLYGKTFGATGDPVKAIYARRDTDDYDPLNMTDITAYGTTYYRNVITFDITPDPSVAMCCPVKNLVADNIEAHYARVTWEGTADHGFNVEHKKASEENWITDGGTSRHNWDWSSLDANTTYQVRVNATCAVGNSEWKVVEFTTLPSCLAPTNLTASDVTANGATISWEENGNATTWELDYNIISQWEGYFIKTIEGEPTYTFTDLNPETTYYIRVKAICGDNDESEWSENFSFTTLPSCLAPTNFKVESVTATTADVAWTANGTASSFDVQYSTDAEFENPSTQRVTPGGTGYRWTIIEGLTPEMTYYARVKANCEDDDESAWSNVISFEPTDKWVIGAATTTSNYLPANNFYNYSLTQQIYTAAELGEAAAIFSIDFYKANDVEMVKDLTIYIVNTNKTKFESNTDWIPVTAADIYYQGTVTFADNAWTTITLDVPYAYDGTSNLAIVVDNNTGDYVASTPFRCYTATANQSLYQYNDNTNLNPTDAEVGTGTLTTSKNMIRLVKGEMPSCFVPTGLAVSEVTGRSAVLSWNVVGDATDWEIQVSTDAGFENPETSYTSGGPNDEGRFRANIGSLTPGTTYYIRVRANCGEGDYSDWSNELSFTTDVACPAPTNLAVSDITPFSANVTWTGGASNYNLRYGTPNGFIYNFESATPWVEDNFPPCTTYDGDGLTTYQITDWTPLGTYQFVGSMMTLQSGVTDFGSAHGGELFGGFVAGKPADGVEHNDDYFILPAIAIENGDVFEFWAMSLLDNWGLERMRVGVYGGNGTITQYLAGSATEYVEVPNEWTKYSYDLSAFAGQSIQLAINSLCPDAYILGIDDIFVGNPDNVTWIETVENATSPYTIAGLDAETNYEVQVQAVCGGDDGSSDWTLTYFTTLSNCAAPSDLEATPSVTSATLEWEGYQNSYNVRYRKVTELDTIFFEGFEEGLPSTWTTIDSDGDGFEWYGHINTGSGNFTTHTGDGCVVSASYDSDEQAALTPDNWLITPQLDLQGTMSVWLGAQDPDYAEEHFAIYLSTTGSTIDDFTIVLVPETVATGEYVEYTADLSSYEGQQGYIAIRHFNCEDMFFLNVDDFGLYDAGGGTPWTEAQVTEATTLTIEGLEGETEYEWQVQGINRSCDGGVTPWSELATFTTLDLCTAPYNLNLDEVTATTATVSWEGYQEAYNVKYRSSEIIDDIQFFDGCNEQGDWTTYNLEESNAEGMASGWDILSGYFTFVYTTNPPQYLISPELVDVELNNSTLWFQYYAYDGEDYPETFKVGFSSTTNDVASFTWGDEITATNSDELLSYAVTVPNDAKYFAIQCTSDDQFALILDNFVICDTYEAPGEWVSVPNVTSPVTIEDLTPNTEYEWGVQGICGDEEYTDWVYSYFTTLEETNLTQTISLVAGANWFSTSIDITLNDLKAALVAAVSGTTITIKAKSGQTSYNPNNGRWSGSITWNVNQMYIITVAQACELTLEGDPINPAEHPITIKKGANWIGFPLNQSMTLTNAFAGFAINGDQVKSKGGTAQYNRGRWQGTTLTNLDSGKGYIYVSGEEEDRTLVFPTGAKAAKNAGMLPMHFDKTRSIKALGEIQKDATLGAQKTMLRNGTLTKKPAKTCKTCKTNKK